MGSMDNKNHVIKELVKKYLNELLIDKKASTLTVRNYKLYLERLINFLEQRELPITETEALTKEILDEFTTFLTSDKFKLKQVTINYHLIALRSFLKFLAKKAINVISSEQIEIPRGDKRQIVIITKAQVNKLLKAAEEDSRDRCIMELLLSTGLRVSDLVKLNRNGINFNRNEIIFDKASHKRIIFLTNSAIVWVKRYLDQRTDNSNALFIRRTAIINNNFRLTARSVERILEKYVKKINLPAKITPQSFRNVFALDIIGSKNVAAETKLDVFLKVTSLDIYEQ